MRYQKLKSHDLQKIGEAFRKAYPGILIEILKNGYDVLDDTISLREFEGPYVLHEKTFYGSAYRISLNVLVGVKSPIRKRPTRKRSVTRYSILKGL